MDGNRRRMSGFSRGEARDGDRDPAHRVPAQRGAPMVRRASLLFFGLSMMALGPGSPVGSALPHVHSPSDVAGRGKPEGLLPGHRIVTFYGNPLSPRMGILGALPPGEMVQRLKAQAREYETLEPERPVVPALHLVTVVAQRDAGRDGMYRSRMPDSLVNRVMEWAEPDSMLVFLDIQPGRSRVETEVAAYRRFLGHPRVHVALDPEFAMGPDQVPGRVIGQLTADDVNRVIQLLADVVEEHGIPPKVLIVHRFTQGMLRGFDRIRLDPRVQVVVNMDGFGPPQLKRDSYRAYVAAEPVQFTAFKLFYQQDVPLMAPRDVLALRPVPLLVIYQ